MPLKPKFSKFQFIFIEVLGNKIGFLGGDKKTWGVGKEIFVILP
jgi:hypothetical protein